MTLFAPRMAHHREGCILYIVTGTNSFLLDPLGPKMFSISLPRAFDIFSALDAASIIWPLNSRLCSTTIHRYFMSFFSWMTYPSSSNLGTSNLYLLVNTTASAFLTDGESHKFLISSETSASVPLAIASNSGIVFPELMTKVLSAKPNLT